MDNTWTTFSNVCGDPNRYAGPYIDMRVAEWIDCTTKPTASETDKAGCFQADYGDTVEITDTVGTHGAIVIKGLSKQTALDIYNVLVGKPIGTTYASLPNDKTTGAWVEQDATDTTKYNVYLAF